MTRHEIARTLEPKQRSQYFQLGNTWQGHKTVRMGFRYDVEEAHNDALWALTQTNWKSVKTAFALLIASGL